MKMERHFVKFLIPGTFFAEETVKPIDSWDIQKAIVMSKEIRGRYDAAPYGFQFITRDHGKVEKSSGIYYINGVVETLEEIKAKHDPNNRILISNMEGNGWDKVVTTCNSYRWTQPFNHEDAVVTVE